ncbi:hypothetical protein [Paenibacillus durus]|nr:hypothetical protein [Paenibacillus durus]
MENEIQKNSSAETEEEFEVEGYYSCSSAAAMCYHDCLFSSPMMSESD